MKNRKLIGCILKDMLQASAGALFLTFIMYVIMAIVPAVQVTLLAKLFDGIYVSNWGDAKLYALLFLGSLLLYSLAEFVYSISMNAGMYERSNAYFKIKLYTKISKLPLLAWEDIEVLAKKERAEEAVSREVLPSVMHKLLTLGRAMVSLLLVSITLAQYSVWLLILPFTSLVPYYLIRRIRGKQFYQMKYYQSEKRRLEDYLLGLFRSSNTIREMRVFGFDRYLEEKFRDVRKSVEEETYCLEAAEQRSVLMCDVIKTLGYGLSIVLVLTLLIMKSITLGAFGACLRSIQKVQDEWLSVFSELGKLPQSFALAEDYYAVFDLAEEKSIDKRLELKEKIEMQNVTFSYPGANVPALQDVSLNIQKNQSVAIVGAVGSGKTTLSRVLMGIYPVDSGKVLYDGEEGNCPYKHFSMVAQDFVKYQDTVAENIAVARAGDGSKLPEFLKQNELDDFISEIGGVDTLLGLEFGGRELSGGQWQQLAIARGLYKESQLLVLDEPTAALDPVMEYEVLKRFLEICRNKTSVIVSHRIGICTKVDMIVVMDHGKIVEIGSHEVLMENKGRYFDMFCSQKEWYMQ